MTRYVTSAHKAVINKITDAAIELSEEGRFHAWANYYGHDQRIEVRVYGNAPGCLAWESLICLPTADNDQAESLNELGQTLNQLESMMQEKRS